MLPEYSRLPLVQTLFDLLGEVSVPNPSSVWTNARPDSQTHNHRNKHSAPAHSSLRIGRTWVGAHLKFPISSCSDEDGNPGLWNWSDTVVVNIGAMMPTTTRKERTHWMGAEPLNGLYGLRDFSLPKLSPHSETTRARTQRTRPSAPGLEWSGVCEHYCELLAFTGAVHVLGGTREHLGLQDRCSRSAGKLASRYPCCGSLCGTFIQAAGMVLLLLLARVQN
ncbi:hypothetical protein QR685DRAFT_501236 [Neurospora intermedia]|uniref:Uncharacterized protein n=1 Tax=Neurospora intermedia TaxID=5142 RepID=A0ABR3D916_NEUIN